MTTIEIKSIQQIDEAAQRVLNAIHGKNIVCFYGTMGAGKTTLIRAICKALGVADVVTSPSFALVNEYTDRNGKPVYHFDFYRIKRIDEVYDFGYEEYFYNPEALCLIEWPELIEQILPTQGVVNIQIAVNADGSRTLQISD
ncbi:MAG: tRNA (adenosine(37)-N6)-threonylcarbamoyltransferase complex ATPase subunit type 1 TsaE [Tenuifilum sp.]|uniref:tRNA (adenosine(37)-N6)-threonylcarbamoyltransferase complex ATPase subunit type 1 TsaE n=1 Tax=Tenuifilum TaxID=2760873 RepID=UPI002BDAE2A9|nr:tRNA (adenosine(37)-N6)-threonylcarbamoyltransferase complex ATPase subunit type 1 TsaE [Tenuifilum sp.]HOK85751.1 tRNA (adenosine(37)-N6)-threonylcarbamoyltransferase complex ATPase subunit type 1 TsaE [Tenuifilum sp.]HON70587.1 tRNA (adenosine(37)-N6)-threonylcarbamoyltransferase complex ATPase subunit type 1 TsaE [Tenuifilum sp.]HOU73948.1 tRNA (adenosine(37)-N6)-threonylcarbamoyltransferase complex ATPase subunit type 1 TsaE [Tenuifilum sp.]HPP90099.1 tRNA (adenosine(37)-N6)-threonylcarb